jgi:arylsulfatase A
LYDLNSDFGEQHNLVDAEPEKVRELTNEMTNLIERGRSTAGPDQSNTVVVKWTRPDSRKAD